MVIFLTRQTVFIFNVQLKENTITVAVHVPVVIIPLMESRTAESFTCGEHLTVNNKCPEETASSFTRELLPIPYRCI